MNFISRAQEVLDVEMQALQQVRGALGKSFAEAIRLMSECLDAGGKIVVTGIGKNLHIAEKVSATLASTGSTSVVLNPVQAMHGDLGILSAGDVLLAMSYSGESEEMLRLIPIVRRMEVKTIALTGGADSSLARFSDAVVCVAVEREACPFNMAPTASTTATLAVGDALAVVLLEARGFRKEDYAKLHPGGAIGHALLMRVADIMRRDERLATICTGAPVREALLAMTRARAGSVGIVDGDSRLLGIFTDGDLRRQLGERADLLDLPIDTVMTRTPVVVHADQLAVDVLRTFEEHKIDDVLVVNEDGRLVGAVDIQDLPKFKIL